MIDLDPILRRALSQVGWGERDTMNALKAIAAACAGSRVDWEEGSEEWGRVLSETDEVVALVWTRIPLGFAISSLAKCPIGDLPIVLRVDDLADENFRISRDLIEQVLARPVSDNLDYEKLSAQDLWWATV
jgi:hypothetical protein